MVKHGRPEATRQLQMTLLTFFVLAAMSFVVIYIVAPAIYVQTLLLVPQPTQSHPLAVTLFMVAILVFVALLAIGVLKQWRWVFWLILIAFGLSILVIPSVALELAGVVPGSIPLWYGLARILVAAVQVSIALWMVHLYRRHGVWAAGDPCHALSSVVSDAVGRTHDK